MKTYVIIIVSVLVISLGIALFFILGGGSSSGSSSGGVNANAIGKRAQFTNIENFKSKEKYTYHATTPGPTTTTQLHSPEKIAKVNNVYQKLIKTLDVYKTAGTLTQDQYDTMTSIYDIFHEKVNNNQDPNAYPQGSPQLITKWHNMVTTLLGGNEKQQNTAIGLLGDYLHFQMGAGSNLFVNWISSKSNNKYYLRTPSKLCTLQPYNDIIHAKNQFANKSGQEVHSGSHDRPLVEGLDHRDMFRPRDVSSPEDIPEGPLCRHNYGNSYPDDNMPTNPSSGQPAAPDPKRIRRVGDNCQQLRQNLWANTWGGLLALTGGVGDNVDCANFDPTDFINNTDTGDWEYEFERNQLVNLFERLFENFIKRGESDDTRGQTGPTLTKATPAPTTTNPTATPNPAPTATPTAEAFQHRKQTKPFILKK